MGRSMIERVGHGYDWRARCMMHARIIVKGFFVICMAERTPIQKQMTFLY